MGSGGLNTDACSQWDANLSYNTFGANAIICPTNVAGCSNFTQQGAFSAVRRRPRGQTPGVINVVPTGGWLLSPTLSQVALSDNGCVNGVGGNPVEINLYTAMSFGIGGLQVGLLDGSVRMIAPSVSPNTWNCALQPNDGNPPGSDW